jgi:hypothetical protein
LIVTSNIVPSSLSHFTLMMDAIRSPETSVLTRATRRKIAEDGIFHSHCLENLFILHSVNALRHRGCGEYLFNLSESYTFIVMF